MRIAILGATGATGREFAALAQSRGHHVAVLVRRSGVFEAGPGLDILVGDATRADDIARAAAGQDAVFCTLGLTAAGSAADAVDVCTAAVSHLIPLMRAGGPRRLVAMSTHGVGLEPGDSPYAARIWALYGERLKDKVSMEAALRASDVDWLAIRAPRISDDEPTGRYRVDPRLDIEVGGAIPRADLVAFALSEIESPRLTSIAVSIAT